SASSLNLSAPWPLGVDSATTWLNLMTMGAAWAVAAARPRVRVRPTAAAMRVVANFIEGSPRSRRAMRESPWRRTDSLLTDRQLNVRSIGRNRQLRRQGQTTRNGPAVRRVSVWPLQAPPSSDAQP